MGLARGAASDAIYSPTLLRSLRQACAAARQKEAPRHWLDAFEHVSGKQEKECHKQRLEGVVAHDGNRYVGLAPQERRDREQNRQKENSARRRRKPITSHRSLQLSQPDIKKKPRRDRGWEVRENQ